MKYSKDLLTSLCSMNHGLLNTVKPIKKILIKDGKEIGKFTKEEAIDLDDYEDSQKKQQEECTVDFVTTIIPNLYLLVENKSNVTNFSDTTAKNIKNKIVHSSEIVHSWNGNYKISEKIPVLLNHKNFQYHLRRARYHLVAVGIMNKIEILTVDSLYEKYFI